jgi:ketosteroid isomerase-like protein
MTTPPVDTVLAWHAALNASDVDRLLGLSTDDVEVGGPRGSGHGADLLRDWLARVRLQMEPLRVFASGDVVVVEQSARWPSPDGQETDAQAVASVFRVQDGRVASVLRHPDLPAALQAAGLSDSDESAAAPSPC